MLLSYVRAIFEKLIVGEINSSKNPYFIGRSGSPQCDIYVKAEMCKGLLAAGALFSVTVPAWPWILIGLSWSDEKKQTVQSMRQKCEYNKHFTFHRVFCECDSFIYSSFCINRCPCYRMYTSQEDLIVHRTTFRGLRGFYIYELLINSNNVRYCI